MLTRRKSKTQLEKSCRHTPSYTPNSQKTAIENKTIWPNLNKIFRPAAAQRGVAGSMGRRSAKACRTTWLMLNLKH